MFLLRISAETCLKMDYFGSKFSKIAKRAARLPLRLSQENAQRPFSY